MKRLVATVGVLAAVSLASATADDPKPGAGGVTVDKDKRTVTVAAKVAPRKLPHLEEKYPVELVAGWGHPKGKKAHEIVVAVDANPSEVHKGLEALGLKPGKPAKGPDAKAEGPAVNVFVEVPGEGGGPPKRLTLDKVLVDPKTKKPAPKMTFRFTGSVMSAADPTKPDDKKYGADLAGTLIALFPVTDETVLQTDWTMKEEKYLKLDVNPDVLPKEGSPVRLVIEAPKQ
ncbi:MAG: YdjY domain-containing protein [Gemmataceae bacterium]|nr:YdjY domain-containing protein [Gemmataceae bacterium]